MSIYTGCAGWSILSIYDRLFPPGKSHLERYAQVFPAVEINTSFYRPHRPETYARWATSTPESFRFAVKAPKAITHESCLGDLLRLEGFLKEISGLGEKLGVILVQLPPGLDFDLDTGRAFYSALREKFTGQIACEPRHAGWFTPEANRMFIDFQIGRVAADPALHPVASQAGGWEEMVYFRLHGSPRMYHSAYSPADLDKLIITLNRSVASGYQVWCIFDNVASGAGLANGLYILDKLHYQRSGAVRSTGDYFLDRY